MSDHCRAETWRSPIGAQPQAWLLGVTPMPVASVWHCYERAANPDTKRVGQSAVRPDGISRPRIISLVQITAGWTGGQRVREQAGGGGA
jgi:hypothetical protein